MGCACTFSRDLCRLRVITSSFDWFTGLSASFLIGQSNYFGLVLRHSIETRSMERLIRPLRGILLSIVTKSKKLLLHHLILVARCHIYICKLKETRPSLEIYKLLVYNTSEIENKIAIANNSMHVFKKKWSCFKNIAPFQ